MNFPTGDGAGNKFVLVPQSVLREQANISTLVRDWCGSVYDGVLWYAETGKSSSGQDYLAPLRKVGVFNRDGSDGELCINGLRVLARWEQTRNGCTSGRLQMGGREISWEAFSKSIRLHLAKAVLPSELSLRNVPLETGSGVAVSFWNPHCVVVVPDLRDLDLAALADEVKAKRDIFPNGVNVEAIQQDSEGGICMRVWERGVGETQACGSGAVAVALLAWAGVEGAPEPVTVKMKGGSLNLSPAPDGGVYVSGPARLYDATHSS